MNDPVYKIQVYDNVPNLRYTIEKDAFDISTTKTLTGNVGTFNFSIPADRPEGTQLYPNIALHDTVKIYFGYGTVDANPSFVGKIYAINGTSTPLGRIRTFTGKDLGEILQRRFRGYYGWWYKDAHDIVVDIANDLGLGTGEIAADTLDELQTIQADAYIPYSTLLQKVSDYWADAANQIKKDFYIDKDFNLVWKARPIRSAGVETLTVGDNILSYNIRKELKSVKNRIRVYGARGKVNDDTLDFGTDMATPEATHTTVDVESNSGQKVLSVTATAGFNVDDPIAVRCGVPLTFSIERHVIASIQAGVSLTLVDDLYNTIPVGSGVYGLPTWTPYDSHCTITAENGANDYKIGDRGIQTSAVGATNNGMEYMPVDYMDLNLYPSINFWAMSETDKNPIFLDLRVGCTTPCTRMNINAAYYTGVPLDNDADAWKFYSIPCGVNCQSGWETIFVTPTALEWEYTQYISFVAGGVADGRLIIDGLHLGNRRFNYTLNDATSQTAYGIREMVVVDDSLRLDSHCQKRGEALLFQLKDPITRLDIITRGNTNILIGDRLTQTIAAEGISAAAYDIAQVTHTLSGDSFNTKLTAVNTSNSRYLPALSKDESILNRFNTLKDVGRGLNILE